MLRYNGTCLPTRKYKCDLLILLRFFFCHVKINNLQPCRLKSPPPTIYQSTGIIHETWNTRRNAIVKAKNELKDNCRAGNFSRGQSNSKHQKRFFPLTFFFVDENIGKIWHKIYWTFERSLPQNVNVKLSSSVKLFTRSFFASPLPFFVPKHNAFFMFSFAFLFASVNSIVFGAFFNNFPFIVLSLLFGYQKNYEITMRRSLTLFEIGWLATVNEENFNVLKQLFAKDSTNMANQSF